MNQCLKLQTALGLVKRANAFTKNVLAGNVSMDTLRGMARKSLNRAGIVNQPSRTGLNRMLADDMRGAQAAWPPVPRIVQHDGYTVTRLNPNERSQSVNGLKRLYSGEINKPVPNTYMRDDAFGAAGKPTFNLSSQDGGARYDKLDNAITFNPSRYGGAPSSKPHNQWGLDALGMPDRKSIVRHEVGHWAHSRVNEASKNVASRVEKLLFSRLRRTAPDVYKALLKSKWNGWPVNILPSELVGHTLAARGTGRGAERLRQATGAGWVSDTAAKLEKVYGRESGLPSAIEHMERNYRLPGGMFAKRRLP